MPPTPHDSAFTPLSSLSTTCAVLYYASSQCFSNLWAIFPLFFRQFPTFIALFSNRSSNHRYMHQLFLGCTGYCLSFRLSLCCIWWSSLVVVILCLLFRILRGFFQFRCCWAVPNSSVSTSKLASTMTMCAVLSSFRYSPRPPANPAVATLSWSYVAATRFSATILTKGSDSATRSSWRISGHRRRSPGLLLLLMVRRWIPIVSAASWLYSCIWWGRRTSLETNFSTYSTLPATSSTNYPNTEF